MIKEQNIHNILFRRNNQGKPCYWFGKINSIDNTITVHHGIVGKTDIADVIKTHRQCEDEYKSMIAAKRKSGYKYIDELRDNNESPVEESTVEYLNAYLPYERTTGDNIMLPMLAKTYDNANNKVFAKCDTYLGQWKINGLRCFISAYYNTQDLFYPIRLRFQSREGTIWRSLFELEKYLLSVLPKNVIDYMLEEDWILDGELYLPGHSVNEINHFVKDPFCKENSLIQYWCYDIAIRETIQSTRENFRIHNLANFVPYFKSKEMHWANQNRLVVLPSAEITNDKDALKARDISIDYGFEGLILRNPYKEYQYGARNMSMIKYKRSTDGIFEIIAIDSEGIKRPDIPIFLLKNDINDSKFEVHVGGTFEYQKSVYKNRDKYIGRKMYVEYGERSGVEQVPFHVKTTYIIDD